MQLLNFVLNGYGIVNITLFKLRDLLTLPAPSKRGASHIPLEP